MSFTIDCDFAFLHGFEQSSLRFWRGSVDLVGEQNVCEDRALCQRERTGGEVKQVGAQHIARHQVRGELDAPKVQLDGGGEALGQKSFRRPGRAFKQNVPA